MGIIILIFNNVKLRYLLIDLKIEVDKFIWLKNKNVLIISLDIIFILLCLIVILLTIDLVLAKIISFIY